MIDIPTIKAVRADCKRLLVALDEAQRRIESEHQDYAARYGERPKRTLYVSSAETATLRRRSMDLTRALADLRRAP